MTGDASGRTHRRDPALMYLGSFVGVGLALSLLGPSIGLLKGQVEVDTGEISAVFTAQGAGYLLGATVIGRRFDRGASNGLFTRGLLTLAVGMAAVPAARSLVVLLCLFGVIGAAAGTIDVGGNTLLTRRRSGAPAAWLAALHLSFGIGALLSPALVAASESLRDDVLFATTVTAVVCCGVAAWAAWADPPPPGHQTSAGPIPSRGPFRLRSVPRRPAMPKGAWLIVGALLLNVAAELSFAGWVHTYSVESGLGAATATGATAGFWAAFVSGRLLSVFLARRVTSSAMLFHAAVLALLGGAVMTIGQGHAVSVWVGVVLIGLGLAPQFPMTIAFAGECFVVTAAMMSRFVAAAGAASLLFPFLTGRLIDAVGPGAFPVTVSVILVANLAWVVGFRRLRARAQVVTPMSTPEAPHTL